MSTIVGVLTGLDRWHVEVCDVLAGLRMLPDASIHCIVTSPPYWGLRNYEIPPSIWGGDANCRHKWTDSSRVDARHKRHDADTKRKGGFVAGDRGVRTSDTCSRCCAWRGCFGDEPTIELYVAHSIDILRECRRVLRDDGQIWWNVGDSYGHDGKWGGATGGKHGDYLDDATRPGRERKTSGLPAGSKLMIPHRVAIAAAADGWIVRQDNVWAKLSPMPESVQSVWYVACRWPAGKDENGERLWRACDGTHNGKPCPRCFEWHGRRVRLQRGAWRCTTSHEFVFQLVKSPDYFANAEAVKERASCNTHGYGTGSRPKAEHSRPGNQREGVPKQNAAFAKNVTEQVTHRNPRSVFSSVWRLAHEPLKEKHFAAFPSAIPHRAIAASTSDHGICPACGCQFAPIVEKVRIATRTGKKSKVNAIVVDPDSPYQTHRGDVCGNRDPKRHATTRRVLGWLPTCDCQTQSPPLPAIVLDIFSGSGTTGRKAFSLGRRFIGFEISPKYAELSRGRIELPYRKRPKPLKHKRPMDGQKSLFQ